MGSNQNDWVELKAGGKRWGRLNRVTMQLETAKGDRAFVFDLVASARDGYAVVRRLPLRQPDERSRKVLR